MPLKHQREYRDPLLSRQLIQAIKRISARRLPEEVASTLESFKKWRKPQEVESEQG